MRTRRIEGFSERVEESIMRSGLSKSEISRRMGAGKQILKPWYLHNAQISSFYVARFCAITKTDANWLLGLTERSKA